MDAQKLEGQATQLRNTGKGYEAVAVYQQAKAAYKAQGELAKAAGCQHMVGVSYKIEHDLPKALPAYEHAIAEYQQAKDLLGPGRVERDMGIMFEYHDRFKEAESHLLKSKQLLQAASQSPERDAELGITLAKLGLLYTRMGEFQKVEAPLFEGLGLIRKVGHPFYEMTALLHVGGYYLATNHPGPGLANLEACLGLIYEYHMQHGQTRRLAQIWGLMAHAYLAYGNKVTAKHFAKKAIAVIGQLSPTAQTPLQKDIHISTLKEELSL